MAQPAVHVKRSTRSHYCAVQLQRPLRAVLVEWVPLNIVQRDHDGRAGSDRGPGSRVGNSSLFFFVTSLLKTFIEQEQLRYRGIAKLLLTVALLSVLSSDCNGESASLETLIEEYLAAELEFRSVCTSLDAQLNSATTAGQIAFALDRFNQSADKAISAWKKMFAALKTRFEHKQAFIHSRDYALTDWDKLKKGTSLSVDAMNKCIGLSVQATDRIREFLEDSRVAAAYREKLKVEARLKDLDSAGYELRRMARELRE
jgi:hypothetical protein